MVLICFVFDCVKMMSLRVRYRLRSMFKVGIKFSFKSIYFHLINVLTPLLVMIRGSICVQLNDHRQWQHLVH